MISKYSTYFPTYRESWILVFLLAIVGGLMGALISFVPILIFPEYKDWISMLMYPVMFIPPFIYIKYKIKERSSSIQNNENPFSFPINNSNFGSLGVFFSFLIVLPLVFAFNIVTEPLSSWMEVPDFMKSLFEQMTNNKITSLLTIVIFAPLLEELFCRGIVLRGLLRHISPAKAIITSAFIFGVMHLNPWQALPAFFVGLLMGWIYWKTGSLWISIFIHFINNGFSYLIITIFPEIPSDSNFIDIIPNNIYIYVYIASSLYIVGSIYLMNKKYDQPLSYKI